MPRHNSHLGDRASERGQEIAGSHRPTPVTPFGCGRPMVVLRPRARFTASRVELHSNLRNPGRLVNLGPRYSAYCPLLAVHGLARQSTGRRGGTPSRLSPFAPRAGQNVTRLSSSPSPQQLTPSRRKQGYGVVLRICRPTPSASCGEPGGVRSQVREQLASRERS